MSGSETESANRWRGFTAMRRGWKWALPLGLALVAPGSPALGGAGKTFDRLSTVRHEVTVSRSRGGQAGDMPGPSSVRGNSSADPLRPYASRPSGTASTSSSNLEPRPAFTPRWSGGPPTVQVQSTPHTFYPGMGAAQGPNASLPVPRSGMRSRGAVLAPGMFSPGVGTFSPGAGMMGPAPSPGQIRR